MNELLEKISLTKTEERIINIPKYHVLFSEGSYYSAMLKEEQTKILEIRKQCPDDMIFYEKVAYEFANEYVPLLLQDYGIYLSPEKIDKVTKLLQGNIIILRPGEAVEKGLIGLNENGKPSGDEGAFAKSEEGLICFTPESESSKMNMGDKTSKEKESIVLKNALRMKGTMIHETFHLLINVMKNEYFEWQINGQEKHKLTSGGFILNEGMVEKFATVFSLRHKLCHNPALDYFIYVDLCNEIGSQLIEDQFFSLAFNNNYEDILSTVLNDEEISLYKLNERKNYLNKSGINNIDKIYVNGPEQEKISSDMHI